jgi:predicted DNA-binding ribbon-helix-helix protein
VKKRWGRTVIKHSIVIRGHKTSFSLEDKFWNDLRHIARSRSMKLSELVEIIDTVRPMASNLSSAIRVFLLQYYMDQIGPLSGLQKVHDLALISRHDDGLIGGASSHPNGQRD